MLEAALAFLAGLLIGSFLNVCVYRMPRDLSVVRPRSHCPACETQIAWYDNIPVLSYLILRGRCRHCGERILIRYLLVELVTAVAFAVCVWKLGLTLVALKFILYSTILIALVAMDLEERILADEFTLGGTLVGLVLAWFVPFDAGIVMFFLSDRLGLRMSSVAEAAASALFMSGSIWLVGWLYLKLRHREGMGLGDVKMIAMIGTFVGLQESLLVLVLASVLGTVSGGAYVLITKKDMSTYELPFGSFIGLAALAFAFGGHIIHW